MTLEVQQATFVGTGQEWLVETVVSQAERHIHPRAIRLVDRVAVQAAGVNEVVQRALLHFVELADSFNTTLLFQPLEYQTGQVPGQGRRGVVHRAVIGRDLVVEHGRAQGTGMTQQVFANDVHDNAARADVFLRAGVDHAEARNIDWARENVRRHVGHQRNVASFRDPTEFQAANGFVRCVVYVGRVFGQRPFVLARNGEVVVGLGGGGNIDVTETRRFFDGFLRPDTGVDIVGGAAFRQQVQGNLSELLAGATLQEQHFIVRGDIQQITQILLGLGGNGHELITAMAHFHDRQTFAVPVEEFTLGALQDGFGKRRRTGTEVIGSLAHIQSRSDLVVSRIYTGRSPFTWLSSDQL